MASITKNLSNDFERKQKALKDQLRKTQEQMDEMFESHSKEMKKILNDHTIEKNELSTTLENTVTSTASVPTVMPAQNNCSMWAANWVQTRWTARRVPLLAMLFTHPYARACEQCAYSNIYEWSQEVTVGAFTVLSAPTQI